ncbi:MAG: amidohydrolase family protein [Planctomycetota bacterium]|nr:amidohydrolase family protein [Planctomycetota bacterium]
MANMVFDVHVHIAQVACHPATDRFLLDRKNWYLRRFLGQLGFTRDLLRRPEANELICRKLADWIAASNIDRVVVLAMDGAYDLEGRPDLLHTRWVTDNDFVAGLAQRHPSILFGASVHPYRADALDELRRVVARGACLVKWIPSAQRIRPDHPRCIPFYELLAEYRVPLLVHTGNEHASSRSLNDWNDPALLRVAIERGVTVIAAHCGARVFLHERCRFNTFRNMALEYENLYGDLGAFGIPTRLSVLRAMQKDDRLLSKIIYGSDFPAWVMPRWFIFSIGPKAVREILREANPLERPYRLMKALGMPREVFSRAATLLRQKAESGGVR